MKKNVSLFILLILAFPTKGSGRKVVEGELAGEIENNALIIPLYRIPGME